MKVRSLTRRVLGLVLAAQIACAAILSLAAILEERHTRLSAFDESLRGRSDSLFGAIQDADDPTDSVRIDPTELRLPHGDVYAVYNADRTLIGASRFAPPDLIAPHDPGFRDQTGHHGPWRVYQRDALRIIDRAETAGVGLKRPVTIVYAAPEGHLRHEILHAAAAYALLILLVVAVTGVAVLTLLSRALRPLDDFAHAASRLAAPSLLFTPPPTVLALAELRPLAAALTRVIESLREAFAKEQRFVADAAHELKTAVAVVRSTVQVLMLRPRSIPEHAAGLTRVLEDVSRIELLVAQMLTSSATEAPPLDTPPLDLAAHAAQTLAELAPLATAANIALSLEAPTPALVHIFPARATTLLSNLILNAIQHSPPGSTVRVLIDPGSLQVIDTGEGIAPEALPHIFERFYREDRSRSRDTGGAGLGLSICQSIVEAAGGTIAIASQPGHGTTVSIIFIQP